MMDLVDLVSLVDQMNLKDLQDLVDMVDLMDLVAPLDLVGSGVPSVMQYMVNKVQLLYNVLLAPG